MQYIKSLSVVLTFVILSNSVLAKDSPMTLYGLELGGNKSLQQQLGVGQQSFYLQDGNQQLSSAATARERAEHQIACRQTGFGITEIVSDTYQKLVSADEYLSSRKEALKRRVKDDLTIAQNSLVNTISKQYAQPQCQWAFNSVVYADAETPTVVSKFKSKSGIDKLATLTFSVDHQGKILALTAEQIVERLDAERIDVILAAIAKRYQVDIDAFSSLNKKTQKRVLEGKHAIQFNVKSAQCQFEVKNTYYRSDAAARYFGINEAHGYIEMGCQLPAYSAFSSKEVEQFVSVKVNDSIAKLLDKHKTQMKAEGQKEKNSGFVF
ncbi:hypothetical protein [Planctobacterium marinum]|uniref:Uncharacterized protein n=1 Tax=Planctobacterium marinum TaxID=1631968 RepID=A0AA48HRC6_9ALTE|nr:hypothetical protein MACH26_21050 [Planctobacterium marinum]